MSMFLTLINAPKPDHDGYVWHPQVQSDTTWFTKGSSEKARVPKLKPQRHLLEQEGRVIFLKQNESK